MLIIKGLEGKDSFLAAATAGPTAGTARGRVEALRVFGSKYTDKDSMIVTFCQY
jgi:hypothetical protein